MNNKKGILNLHNIVFMGNKYSVSRFHPEVNVYTLYLLERLISFKTSVPSNTINTQLTAFLCVQVRSTLETYTANLKTKCACLEEELGVSLKASVELYFAMTGIRWGVGVGVNP